MQGSAVVASLIPPPQPSKYPCMIQRSVSRNCCSLTDHAARLAGMERKETEAVLFAVQEPVVVAK